ncbi:unnamed protein product [Microthlaspi erraticum]|uniref:F-box domain-containing protein n=1 Tax=Microthlaspi erraticum TaxID=1685480 RepID=A0A6D2HRL4_9BRAS|nr:unnamed protein product [Microthlaspi erraticum]
MKSGEYGNWAELPPELTSSILVRLGAIEILQNAQRVCTSWYRACKDPSMWRKIHMHKHNDYPSISPDDYDYNAYMIKMKSRHEAMARHAVDRSQGGLVEIDIWLFGTGPLLSHIVDSSRDLRVLRIPRCHEIPNEGPGGLIEAVGKLPLFEELDISYGYFLEETLKIVGKSCPNLKMLRLRTPEVQYDDAEFAVAIAETMPQLRHLQLLGNEAFPDEGLEAILDGCRLLEHLDLRGCRFLFRHSRDLEKRCSERIRVLRRPDESTADAQESWNLATPLDDWM